MSPLILMCLVTATFVAMCAAWYRARAPALVFARTRTTTARSGRGAEKEGVTAIQACPEPFCLPLTGPLPAPPPWGLEAAKKRGIRCPGPGDGDLIVRFPGHMAKRADEEVADAADDAQSEIEDVDGENDRPTPSQRSKALVRNQARVMFKGLTHEQARNLMVELKAALPASHGRAVEAAYTERFRKGKTTLN